jgi:hypothetical protein
VGVAIFVVALLQCGCGYACMWVWLCLYVGVAIFVSGCCYASMWEWLCLHVSKAMFVFLVYDGKIFKL